MREEPRLRPRELIATLNAHEVAYVLIGALAATLYGYPVRTNDADICPDRAPKNLERLAAALNEMDARVYTSDDPLGVPFRCDAQMLAQAEMWNLVTSFGRLDISFTPSGTGGYADLSRSTEIMDIGAGVQVSVAALLDIIRSKDAAGRPKDQLALPVLRDMLERQREQDDS